MSGALDSKVVLVTGSTSGIGRASAIACAEAGANVVVTGRRAEAADQVAADVAALGVQAYSVPGDITDSAFCVALASAANERFGRLDGIVNAAGMIVRADAVDTTDDQWRQQMAVNVDGVFYLSRACLPHMTAEGGSIVNVSSTCGLVGSAGLAGYCASKGAVISLTQAMALEHASDQVRVNAVCPGAVDTPMLSSGREDAPMGRAEVMASNLASIPQGRIPDASEVAATVVFLLSNAARHITGASIPIDGGYTAQ